MPLFIFPYGGYHGFGLSYAPGPGTNFSLHICYSSMDDEASFPICARGDRARGFGME